MKRLTITSVLVSFLLTFGLSAMAPAPGQAQGSISGVVEMNYTHIGTKHGKSKSDDKFSVQDVMFYVQGPVGNKAKFFSEFMINPRNPGGELHSAHDQSIRVERMYLSTQKLVPDHTLKLGLFQNFDGVIKNYHVATGNPLPGDVIFFKNPWAGHHTPTLHGVFTDVGLSLSGRKGPIGYKLNVFNGQGQRNLSNGNASPQGIFGKVQYTSRSLPGLQVGLSYYNSVGNQQKITHTETTDTTVVTGGDGDTFVKVLDTKTETKDVFEPEDEYAIAEVIYRRPSYRLTAMYLDGSITRAGHDKAKTSEGSGYMAEALYKATGKLSLVGRYQTVEANRPTSRNFLGAGTVSGHGGGEFRGDLEQTELGVNYQWSPRWTFKTSWQNNENSASEQHAADRIMAQVAASF